jgi:hypothetical protein
MLFAQFAQIATGFFARDPRYIAAHLLVPDAFVATSRGYLKVTLGISHKEQVFMSSSPSMASDTPKPAQAPNTQNPPAKPAPQQNQDNQQADGKPARQQQK